MENKYYYDDPLAAAWMARNFNIRFKENFLVDDSNALPTKLYIHENSLAILEMRIGDLVLIGGRNANTVDKMDNDYFYFWNGMGKKYDAKTIIRNGLAFMQPKVR